MKIRIRIIDAFTEKRFQGNPAAVVITEQWLSDQKMQLIATENNLSETAFAVPQSNGVYQIRWFSPIKEIDFCGHATLATAFVIFSEQRDTNKKGIGQQKTQVLRFYAESVGELVVERTPGGVIEMCFPAREPVAVNIVPPALYEGLSKKPVEVLRSEQAYFAIYRTEADVKSLTTDSELLKQLAPWDLVATAPGTEHDFVSRYFWPANGGIEDPVTGSIHAGLAPFWAKRLDKQVLLAFQASERGGLVSCRVNEANVIIAGSAVQYLDGVIQI